MRHLPPPRCRCWQFQDFEKEVSGPGSPPHLDERKKPNSYLRWRQQRQLVTATNDRSLLRVITKSQPELTVTDLLENDGLEPAIAASGILGEDEIADIDF